MGEKLKKCPVCTETFVWSDKIIYITNMDEYYHEKCIEIYPVSYLAFDNGTPLGDVEDEAIEAYDILSEGQFIDVGV